MKNLNKKYCSLLCFLGSGSKLMQAQINNAKDVFTIPAYPLKFFPPLFKEWEKKDNYLTSNKVLKLIIKHHKSILDSRYLKGFNGLNNLGSNKASFIKISEKKFKQSFIFFLKSKKISEKNVYLAIHYAYQFAINDKSSIIMFHPHDIEFFNSFIIKNFENSKILAITRNPVYNFWRRAYSDQKVEEGRFDKTDCEYIKNYRYINRLRDLCINFKNLNSNYAKICKFFTFENLKINNKKTLQKVCKFLNIKFSYNSLRNPRFDNKIWWGDKVYKGFNAKSKKSFVKDSYSYKEELKLFSNYEIFILECVMYPFMKKFKFKTYSLFKNSNLDHLKFFLYVLLPTKYGLSLFFARLNFRNLGTYLSNTFKESFGKKNIKNYYFNAMYRHKWSYKIIYLIKLNFLRKLFFRSRNNFLLKILYFSSKVIIYPYLQIELIFLYLVRIYFLIYLYFNVKNKIKYIQSA
tara:strand:+ start:388 stop:1773 length:1386 start_codon:yes stop_codon:yes gene_type:complete